MKTRGNTKRGVKKEQRVAVFVDVSNLYHSAKNLYNKKVSFPNLLRIAVEDRKLVRAIAYGVRSDINEQKKFFDILKKFGYEVKLKDLQVFPGGAKKGDWDIGIAMDMIELSPKVDVEILISGDGDFVDLVNHLHRACGIKVEAASFRRSTSKHLVDIVDKFIDLGKFKKTVLM
ncbi:hypothetical protein CL614_02025 [archaeon]|nr:hypothetical protein [archaeon]|tara:strand:+ start:621 stop:1142 length:522 start_codon:yes stop_codon:yes gene_type:complete